MISAEESMSVAHIVPTAAAFATRTVAKAISAIDSVVVDVNEERKGLDRHPKSYNVCRKLFTILRSHRNGRQRSQQ